MSFDTAARPARTATVSSSESSTNTSRHVSLVAPRAPSTRSATAVTLDASCLVGTSTTRSSMGVVIGVPRQTVNGSEGPSRRTGDQIAKESLLHGIVGHQLRVPLHGQDVGMAVHGEP